MPQVMIIESRPDRMVAIETPPHTNFVQALLVVVFISVAGYAVWTRSWKVLGVAGVFCGLMFASVRSMTHGSTFRMTIDVSRSQITSDEISSRGRLIREQIFPASAIASADMQFNRGARTIVLIHRDGSQSFPLGEEFVQDEPDQYVVLNALRTAIGQVPVAPQ